MRDEDAGVKLRGSLLRLQVFRPEGFTAAELSEAASVAGETSRDFLKNCRYTELVGTRPSPSGKGRPVNLYRVTQFGGELLTQEIVKLREQALLREGLPEDVFSSLVELEETVEDMEMAVGDERAELRTEAERALKSCRTDLRALEKLSRLHADEFRTRLGRAEGRLTRLVDEFEDLVRGLVRKYGCWVDREASVWEPMLVLFDGIAGPDKAKSRVIEQSLKKDIPVASFDLAAMTKALRKKLFKSVGSLRAKTPLVGCDLVITVNSETDLGQVLITEIKNYAPVVQAGKRLWHDDREHVRQKHILKAATYIASPEPRIRAFALKCAGALTAIEAVASREESGMEDLGDYIVSGDPISLANTYMGNVVCVDSSYNETAATELRGTLVTYRPLMAHHKI